MLSRPPPRRSLDGGRGRRHFESQPVEDPVRVGDLMSPATSVLPLTPVETALAMVRESGAQYLPVVNRDGDVVGLIRAADLTSRPDIRTVAECATISVVGVSPAASVGEAAAVMWEHNVAALPVVNARGNLLGVLTWSALCAAGLLTPE
jgi:CBS domain-containing protein